MNPDIREETRALRRLAVPIVLTNLGTMAMGLVDTLMVGRLNDPDSLAAVALAGVWIHGTSLFAMGLVFGMDPIITQGFGARDRRKMGLALHRGFLVALLASLGVMWCWSRTGAFLNSIEGLLPGGASLEGFSESTVALADRYSQVQVWSAAPFLLFIALRQHLQGRGIVRPALVAILACNVVNALANHALIFGAYGFPAMGLEGAGIATGITRAAMFGLLALMVWQLDLLRGARTKVSRHSFSIGGVRELLGYGIPTAFQMALEVWAFGAATLMAGLLGQAATSAHHIVLNLASTTFMVPMGISFAATTRVGNLLGARRPRRAQTAAWVSIALGAGTMSVSAVIFVTARHWVPSLYFGDTQAPGVAEVITLCAAILPIAAAFQIFDGIQVVGCGVLRGMGQTMPAAVINLVGYWVLALPLAWWMTSTLGLGLFGIWWGIAIGLAIVAVALLAFLRVRGPARSPSAI